MTLFGLCRPHNLAGVRVKRDQIQIPAAACQSYDRVLRCQPCLNGIN